MTGIYDRLLNQIGDDDDQPAGMTPLDISDLPEAQRQIMFWLLRQPKASASGVTAEALHQQFEEVDNLSQILDDLTKDNWIIRLGETPNEHYKINLRRKRPSKLSANLWSSLSDRLEENESNDEDSGSRRGKSGLPARSDW